MSDNLLDRVFEASARNQKRIADFASVRTAEGWFYVAAVVDHLMPPVGSGVNLAMLDASDLATAIANTEDWQTAAQILKMRFVVVPAQSCGRPFRASRNGSPKSSLASEPGKISPPADFGHSDLWRLTF